MSTPTPAIGSTTPTSQFTFKVGISPNTHIYPPFDISREDLDVILRSSDSVYFHVLKIFLSVASPFFRDMFALPQPTEAAGEVETKEGRPVIPITEPSTTIEKLLMYCYPAWNFDSPFGMLIDVQDVLEAATKYDMSGVVQRAAQALLTPRFLEQEPLRVFAIACRYKLTREAMLAAHHTLRAPVSTRSYIPELDYISAGTLQRLLDYHFQCGRAAKLVTTTYHWITQDDCAWFHFSCLGCSASGKTIAIAGMRIRLAAAFWLNYLREVGYALAECPCVATVMRKDLLDSALAEANACATCSKTTRKKASEDLHGFRVLLAMEVEKALSPIVPDFQF